MEFVKTDEYCYVGSLAMKQIYHLIKRGEFYILVIKILVRLRLVQIEAGYNYKIGPEIIENR